MNVKNVDTEKRNRMKKQYIRLNRDMKNPETVQKKKQNQNENLKQKSMACKILVAKAIRQRCVRRNKHAKKKKKERKYEKGQTMSH